MKRLVAVVTPPILLRGSVLLGLSDTNIAIAHTSIPDKEVASNMSKVQNSTANATITITMYAGDDEWASNRSKSQHHGLVCSIIAAISSMLICYMFSGNLLTGVLQ